MADYRSVQTRMWREDEWFQELDVEARLLWIYLFTNPSASPAGIYRLPLRTIAFESGVRYEAAQDLIQQFSNAGKAYYEDGVLWVVNMRRLQFPGLVDGSKEWQTATRISRDIDLIPDRCQIKARYLAHSGYPIVNETIESGKTVKRVSILYPGNENTPLIPHASGIDTQSVNSNITETITETQPNETHVAVAVAAWESLGLTINPFTFQQLSEAVDEWSTAGHPEYVAQAIAEAGRHNVRTWAYVEGILRRCRDESKPPSYTNGKTEAENVQLVPENVTLVFSDGTTQPQEVMSRGA